ncbi:MAG: BamA/TamA family outer membrane protein [Moraxella sp.]|nr:BamA/TamA family outer membrane protein [Moraxella sp.]
MRWSSFGNGVSVYLFNKRAWVGSLGLAVMACAWADDGADTAPFVLLSPEQIEQKLSALTITDPYDDTPVSHLNQANVPLGLDVNAITRLPTLESVTAMADTPDDDSIDPSDYIPALEVADDEPMLADDGMVDTTPTTNPAKKLYNRLFQDGVEKLARLKVQIYTTPADGERSTDLTKLYRLDKKALRQQPYANIIATLTDNTAQSVADFRTSAPKLRQAVKTASRAVGYYDLDFSLTKTTSGEINVIIHDLGEPVVVQSQILEVRGDGADDVDYRTIIENAPLRQGDVFHHGLYETTKTAIDYISAEKGYFDSRWLDHSSDIILPDNIADVSLIYESGQQYVFDDVIFFTIDPDTKELTTDPNKLPVKPKILKQLMSFEMGDAYNRTAIRNLSNSLLATGYFNGVNTEMVLPEHQTQTPISFENTNQAQSGQSVQLDDGVAVDIAPIEFSTSQALSDKLAMVTQKAQRLYNAPDDRLLITDTTKQSKSIFGRISDAVSTIARAILPDESSDLPPELAEGQERPALAGRKSPQEVYQDKKIPLYVFVVADKPKDAQIGLGWGSDSGARLGVKLEHKLLNQHGMQAGVDIGVSQNSQRVDTYITRPMSHPLNDILKASLSFENESVNQGVGNFDLSSKTLETALSRNIVKQNGWSRSYSVRYHLDELETKVSPEIWENLPIWFLNGKPTQEALLMGYAMNKVVSDNTLLPMQGYRQYYSLEMGLGGLLTDTNMAIARTGISGVYSFGDNAYGKKRAHQVLGGVQAGYLWADDFNAVPYKLRFFAGGDQSIRGYGYKSLSPLSDKGYLMGGQALAVATGEYNYEVLEGLRLGVFADVGNAYDKDFKNDTKIGAGVGVRWASPVGQVRLDVATGIKEEGNPIKIHFFIGMPF